MNTINQQISTCRSGDKEFIQEGIKYIVSFYGYKVSEVIGVDNFKHLDCNSAGFYSYERAEDYAKEISKQNPGIGVYIFKRDKVVIS